MVLSGSAFGKTLSEIDVLTGEVADNNITHGIVPDAQTNSVSEDSNGVVSGVMTFPRSFVLDGTVNTAVDLIHELQHFKQAVDSPALNNIGCEPCDEATALLGTIEALCDMLKSGDLTDKEKYEVLAELEKELDAYNGHKQACEFNISTGPCPACLTLPSLGDGEPAQLSQLDYPRLPGVQLREPSQGVLAPGQHIRTSSLRGSGPSLSGLAPALTHRSCYRSRPVASRGLSPARACGPPPCRSAAVDIGPSSLRSGRARSMPTAADL